MSQILTKCGIRYCSFIDQAINMFVPLAYNKSRKNPRLMNRLAKSARNYKSRMVVRYRQSRSYSDLIEYKIAQNKTVKEYRNAMRQFEKKLAN